MARRTIVLQWLGVLFPVSSIHQPSTPSTVLLLPPPPVRQAAAPASKLPFPAPPLRATAPAPNCPTLLPHSEQLHLVLVDLNAAKDTTSILRSLQAAYPKPSGVSECACMHV